MSLAQDYERHGADCDAIAAFSRCQTLDELLNEYEDSVGHNSNYMLELSPNRAGAIPAADHQAYVAFGKALARCYTTHVRVHHACTPPLPAYS